MVITSFLRIIWSRVVKTVDTIFETTSSKFLPLQLFGSKKSPFLWIFQFTYFHYSISKSSLKQLEQIWNRACFFSSFKVFITFGDIPFRPGALWRVNLLIVIENSFQEREELILLSTIFWF